MGNFREERESTSALLERLTADLGTVRSELAETQGLWEGNKVELSASQELASQLEQDQAALKEKNLKLTEEKESQQKLIGKVSTCA